MKNIIDFLINNTEKVKINSKDITKGDVFVTLPGGKKNSSNYILDAIQNGAKFIITDIKNKKDKFGDNIVFVDNVIIFLHDIAIKKRELFKGQVIGITGSIGKTSVKENLNYFLSKNYKVSYSIKSYNNYLGVIISLLNMNLKANYSIFELGTNDFLEIRRLTLLVKPDQTIITNIYPTHLEKLINTSNIAIEKSDIFNKKYNRNVELAILPNNNIDEKKLIKIAKNQDLKRIITFGKDLKSDLLIKKIVKDVDNYYKINLIFNKKNFSFLINQDQIHRINNILICFLIYIYNNIDLKFFYKLTKFVPLIDGRGIHKEIYVDNKKVNLIDESYNASPQSMKICIDYFDDLMILDKQKKFLILGDMKELGDKSIDYHMEILNYILKKNIENVVICGELMQRALIKINNNNNILFMLNIDSIRKYITKKINSNDFLLIKGSNSSLTNTLAKIFSNKEVK